MANTMMLSVFLAAVVMTSAYKSHGNMKPGTCPFNWGQNNGQSCRTDSDCPFVLKCCPLGFTGAPTCTYPVEFQGSNPFHQGLPQILPGQIYPAHGLPQILPGQGLPQILPGQGLPQILPGQIPSGVSPILPGGKPGVCPRPTGAGICVELCGSDLDCPGIQKCCSNGCGHVCTLPRSSKKIY